MKTSSNRFGIIAVDPGVSGGIAFTDGTKLETSTLDHPDVCTHVRNFLDLCEDIGPVKVYIEQVGGFIGKEQPGAYMFTFGESFGRIKGWFEMAGIEPHFVPPKKWMRAVAPGVLGIDYNDRKRALKQLAQSWYPDVDVTLKLGDALCLLEYARRMETEPRPAIGGLLANTSGNFAADAKAAAKWAKAQGWQVPKRGSKEHVKMVNYYCQKVRN